MTNDKLPEEIIEQIESELGKLSGQLEVGNDYKNGYCLGVDRGYTAGATAWAPWYIKHMAIESELHGVRAENERLKDAAIMFCNKFNVSQTTVAEMVDFLSDIAVSDCDTEVVNYSRPKHSTECRACKAKTILQQFKDGKEMENEL